MKAVNGFLMTQDSDLERRICGYVMVESFIGVGRFLSW